MTTAPTPHLLPCPFCGGPASAHEVNPKEAPGWVRLTVAHTPDCFSRAPKETLLLSAADLERWNRRAELEARKPLPLSDWIDADERRPEAYLDVLVVIDCRWVTTGEWLHAQKTWCWEQTGGEPDESRVTHWMHMPSPPAHGITGGSS